MNVTSIDQQHVHNNKNVNQTQNSTANFQDELNRQQGGRWKNHNIEWLSPSQNQALNNKLDEMGITSDEEIYQIKSEMEVTQITYESLGVTNPSIILKSFIKSLEFGEERDGLSDTDTKLLEVLYAIQENDLKSPSVGNELNKYLSNSVNKLLYDEKSETGSIEMNNLVYTKPKVSEYVSFQREIEQSNEQSALSLSV